MPRYDYRCTTCGYTREFALAANEDDSWVFCNNPECPAKREHMERLPAAPNFSIKGKYAAKTGYSGN